ncbi:DUF1223 domain-containing protein [Sphingorhabdus sp.]|uniref:DUF1223 domain-containing protein n=1 Tax=Sphingorhabdus sp. TaxID=1902408 RepID=UPI0039830ABD
MPSKASGDSNGLIVVELYQSQGCSSCPPANAALNAIAARSDVIALSFAVTYWDRLGWKDIFGDPAYTKRQYAYASALGNNGVYTPQVVLNGRRAIVGNRPGELERAVAATRDLSGGPSIDVNSGSVAIGAGNGNGDVLLIRYDPRNHDVAIRTGENGGRQLPHRNIVRQLVKLGKWDGNSVIYKLPVNPNIAWQSAILVQSKQTGPILAAKKL